MAGSKPWEREWTQSGGGSTASAKPWERQWSQQEASSAQSPNLLQYYNQGIANMLGVPVDLARTALDYTGISHLAQKADKFLGTDDILSEGQIGGSKSINKAMSDLGASTEQPPETLAQNVAVGAGEAMGGAGMFSTAGKGLQATSGAAKAAGDFLTKGTTKGALVAENLAGATARGAGHVAEEGGVEDPYARFLIEFGAGMAGGLAPMAATTGVKNSLIGRGFRAAGEQLAPLRGRKGGEQIAAKVMAGASEDADGALTNLEAYSRDLANDATLPQTPAVASRDPGLQRLQRVAEKVSPDLAKKSRTVAEDADRALRDTLISPDLEGVSRRTFKETLQQKIATSGERAQALIDRLAPRFRDNKTERNRIVREELSKGYGKAKSQVEAMWNAVPKKLQGSYSNLQKEFDDMMAGTSFEVEDIPKSVMDRLEGDRMIGSRSLSWKASPQVNIFELQGLRSRLLDDARSFHRKGQSAKARAAYRLADATMQDLDAVSGANPALRRALRGTKDLKDVYESGTVGQILHPRGDGVPEATILERKIGTGGPKAVQALKEFDRAMKRSGPDGFTRVNEQAQDYLKDSFTGMTATAKQDFIRKNQEILRRFPKLKRDMQKAADSEIAARDDFKGTPAAKYAESGYGREIKDVFNMREFPGQVADNLIREAKEADRMIGPAADQNQRSLRRAMVDHIIESTQTGFDDIGQPILSGDNLNKLLNGTHKSFIRRVLGNDKMRVLDRFSRDMREANRISRMDPQGALLPPGTAPMITILSRFLGAGAARAADVKTLQGISVVSSTAGKGAQMLTAQNAISVIKEALEDPETMKMLLRKHATREARQRAEWHVMEVLRGVTSEQAAGE